MKNDNKSVKESEIILKIVKNDNKCNIKECPKLLKIKENKRKSLIKNYPFKLNHNIDIFHFHDKKYFSINKNFFEINFNVSLYFSIFKIILITHIIFSQILVNCQKFICIFRNQLKDKWKRKCSNFIQ